MQRTTVHHKPLCHRSSVLVCWQVGCRKVAWRCVVVQEAVCSELEWGGGAGRWRLGVVLQTAAWSSGKRTSVARCCRGLLKGGCLAGGVL